MEKHRLIMINLHTAYWEIQKINTEDINTLLIEIIQQLNCLSDGMLDIYIEDSGEELKDFKQECSRALTLIEMMLIKLGLLKKLFSTKMVNLYSLNNCFFEELFSKIRLQLENNEDSLETVISNIANMLDTKVKEFVQMVKPI